jgi:hypothetical protein
MALTVAEKAATGTAVEGGMVVVGVAVGVVVVDAVLGELLVDPDDAGAVGGGARVECRSDDGGRDDLAELPVELHAPSVKSRSATVSAVRSQ